MLVLLVNEIVYSSIAEVARLQKQTRDSLHTMWKNCLSNDWLPIDSAHSFSLKYVTVANYIAFKKLM